MRFSVTETKVEVAGDSAKDLCKKLAPEKGIKVGSIPIRDEGESS